MSNSSLPIILVAGGTGALGSAVVERLKSDDRHVRVLSQRASPANLDPSYQWAQADVVTGVGLQEALRDVDIIVNCIGNAQDAYKTDVLGVKRLAEMAKDAGVKHFFHISIVGIEQIELQYYRYKVQAEAVVIESGVPYSIQRLTQFHTLLDHMMTSMRVEDTVCTLPIAGTAQFQPIDTRDVAAYISPLLFSEFAGRLPDVGGPQILHISEIARVFHMAQGITGAILVDPETGFFPSTAVDGFMQGLNTVPDNRHGQITWSDYIRERYIGAY